jgi:hypothetical protein
LEEKLPISRYVKKLFLIITTSECEDRLHTVILSINDDNVIDTLVKDCTGLFMELNTSISPGHKRIKLFCDGFSQNEEVTGNGKVSYSISLFPFDSTDPTAEHTNNLDDPLINSTKQIIKNKIKQLKNFTIS